MSSISSSSGDDLSFLGGYEGPPLSPATPSSPSSSSSSSRASPSPSRSPPTTERRLPSTVELHDGITRLDEVARQCLHSVCLVQTPNDWGTGCFIRGGLLLTNAHVLKSEKEASQTTISIIRFVSKNSLGVVTYEALDQIKLDPGAFWKRSQPPEKNSSGFSKSASKGFLDYTLVAIEPHPYIDSIQQYAFSIFQKVKPKEKDVCIVFQHPKGEPKRVVQIYGAAQWQSGIIGKVDKYFMHHSAPTVKGSSGGAIVGVDGNNDYQLLGLHYQGEINCRGAIDCSYRSTHMHCNAGVNINAIRKDLMRSHSRPEIEVRAQQINFRQQSELAMRLIAFHRRRLEISLGQGLFFPIENTYTDLAMITDEERIRRNSGSFEERLISSHKMLYESKTPVLIDQLFDKIDEFLRKKYQTENLKDIIGANRKRALIYGVAGVGKTTFSEMAALHGTEWWPQFSTIILIKLRNLNEKKYPQHKTHNLEKILEKEHYCTLGSSPLERVSSAQFEEFLRGGFIDKSLLILDGLDECPEELRNGSLKGIFSQLIEKFNNILITSRPGAILVDEIGMNSWPDFEIIGFDSASIDNYIESFYCLQEEKGAIPSGSAATKIEQLRSQLEMEPTLHNLMQIPINLVLTCLIFTNDKTRIGSSTQTTSSSISSSSTSQISTGLSKFSLTQFYTKAINWLYARFLSPNSLYIPNSVKWTPAFRPKSL